MADSRWAEQMPVAFGWMCCSRSDQRAQIAGAEPAWMTPSDQAHKGRSTDKRILAFAFTVGDSCLEAIAAYNVGR